MHTFLGEVPQCRLAGQAGGIAAAIAVAREQNAKFLELKLGVSLYDLHELRQSADTYRSQLGEIYGRFSEGFDTPDLVRAKAKLRTI